MKLGGKLSIKQFVLFLILIVTFGLIFAASYYYILHFQYQKPLTPLSVGPVTTPPKTLRLDLDQPNDNFLTFQPSVIVSGQTAPNINVLISASSEDMVIPSTSSGAFSTVLNLDEGANQVSVTVFDTTGDSRSVSKTVYYSKEKI